MHKRKIIHYVLALFLLYSGSISALKGISEIDFKQISSLNGLPTNEIQKIYQDHDGFIWFATRQGFFQYDGYHIENYNLNIQNSNAIVNNNIYCMAEDNMHNMWIGTQEGLIVLNKITGELKHIHIPEISNNTISCIIVTRDHRILIGTDTGLCEYLPEKDQFVLYSPKNTNNVLPLAAIKCIYEDTRGDIWIGTWSQGLFRYSPSLNQFYAYPQMNPRNSAHVIYEDSKDRIWVGTWDEGLFLLQNPRDLKNLSWINFKNHPNDTNSISDNIIYDIAEDLNTNSIWIGTRSGLSIINGDSIHGKFTNYKPFGSPHKLPSNEVNSIYRDHTGMMWLGTIGGGVFMANTTPAKFKSYTINATDDHIPGHAVRSILVDNETNIWLGIGSYGLARYNASTHKYSYFKDIPEFSKFSSMPTINSMIQLKRSKALWIATYGAGIFVYKKGEEVINYTHDNCHFIAEGCVAALFEDKDENIWVGSRNGIGIKKANGQEMLLNNIRVDGVNLSNSYVNKIAQDKDGSMWISTLNNGVIHIQGSANNFDSLHCTGYNPTNKKLLHGDILTLNVDQNNRIWLGTQTGGLFKYNAKQDAFESVNTPFNLTCNMIGSIENDLNGDMWLGTNYGLIRLHLLNDSTPSSSRIYTVLDGLQDNFFIPNSSFNYDGEMYFGSYKGFNSFLPNKLTESKMQAPIAITNIKIYNESLADMNVKERMKISKTLPNYTSKIKLNSNQNNFNIEFATLTFYNSEHNSYAYQLVGFDKSWQFTDASHRFAYYNNLESGTYTFKLKASNANGVWSDEVKTISIQILPPLWATWQAYFVYLLLSIGFVILIFRTTKNRMLLKNQLHIREIEQNKSEELNHTKLQFFTNITHELLTPLTIISASIDELKTLAPLHQENYMVIKNNVTRLLRLLQQILEFRKADSGNLKLHVTSGDLSTFIHEAVDSFRPLIKKRKLHLSLLCDPEHIEGYFDHDKLDKILYNLLSNAAKYVPEGGFIQVNLNYIPTTKHMVLKVEDNGKGLSTDVKENLFKRFYDGKHKIMNTTGTGIGLSLTKDLVELHHGTIELESEENKGTTVTVCFPINQNHYKNEELDFPEEQNTLRNPKDTSDLDEDLELDSSAEYACEVETHPHSILIIEDNLELLEVMNNLLNKHYKVHVAKNGNEGLAVVERENIDLIISDVMMPVMDGFEFCKIIKSHLDTCHIPIIVLTAKNQESDRAEAYESGADGYISKPFSLTVLHAKIKNLIKQKERIAGDFKKQLVFEINDLKYTSMDEAFLQKAINCVHKHLNDCDFDQTHFTDEMNTSKSTLYKKLKSLTGLNTSAFIRNIRLKAACSIAEEKPNVRISELAYAVGFNDPKYFSSCFKKEFGMLPSEYIEKYTLNKNQ